MRAERIRYCPALCVKERKKKKLTMLCKRKTKYAETEEGDTMCAGQRHNVRREISILDSRVKDIKKAMIVSSN